MRIAIVHDWFVVYAGAERVIEQLLLCYPEADLYGVVDFLPEDQRAFLHDHKVKTTFIQKLPFAKKYFRHYLPLMPLAIEQLDMSSYDVVISSSHAVAKGVLTSVDQLHLCYIYTPMRYAWEMQHEYLRDANKTRGPTSWMMRYILHKLRIWDVRTANGIDQFIAISHYIAKRVKKTYRRDADVIYPPVDIQRFSQQEEKEDFYITVSRLVPYKRVDAIVKAFANLPDKQLYVIGDGPELERLKSLATENVKVLGRLADVQVADYLKRARAYIFAAKEDFGIAPVEAQACGTPVIAYDKGGCIETLTPEAAVFFQEQTPEAIQMAVEQFEKVDISPKRCRENAERFSNERFRKEFTDYFNQEWQKFKEN